MKWNSNKSFALFLLFIYTLQILISFHQTLSLISKAPGKIQCLISQRQSLVFAKCLFGVCRI